MEFISKATVTNPSGQPTLVLSNIPQTYTDLYLVVSSRSDRSDAYVDAFYVYLNGAGASAGKRLYSLGSTPSSQSNLPWPLNAGDTAIANQFGNAVVYIPNYTEAIAHAFFGEGVSSNNSASATMSMVGGLSTSTAAVTSITLDSETGSNFKQHTTATLYGVRKYDVSTAPKATGGIISYDSVNDYWYHTFTGSGTFTPIQSLSAQYLVVAGGGAGGYQHGGGGGAGGYLTGSGTLSATGYTITVGAGGAASTLNGSRGGKGGTSSFNSLSANGGGGGGTRYTETGGGAGGSGGGGGFFGAAGTATPAGQGNAGGAGEAHGGGGGGAGAAGQASTSTDAGDGGDGLQWLDGKYYAGGGGGGHQGTTTDPISVGGLGGGGNGSGLSGSGLSGEPGVAGTGGGGGGTRYEGVNLGNGGSGVVIIRYAA